jgi:hypothetical protein
MRICSTTNHGKSIPHWLSFQAWTRANMTAWSGILAERFVNGSVGVEDTWGSVRAPYLRDLIN